MNARYVCVALLGVVVTRGAVMAGMGMQAGVLAQWIDRTPPGKQALSPKGVENCAMVYDPARHRIVLFGGKNAASRLVNDLWAFDLAKSVWQEIPIEGEKPPIIENLSAIHDPIGHRMIVYGDRNLWSLDLKTDSWRNMSAKDAPRRESHSAIYDERGKRMVVFGGSDGGRQDLYDVWAFDLDPTSPTFEKWQDLTVEEGHPPGRMEHTAVYDFKKNRMLIHAGIAKIQRLILEDTWEYQFDERRDKPGRWRQISNGRVPPPARRKAVSIYDAARHRLILQGGESNLLNGHDPIYLNDVWAFDLTSDAWLDITPSDPGPAAKVAQQAVYDSDTQSVIFYGGVPENEHLIPHDVWELQIQPGK
jgi:hypothetical protein